MENNKKPYLVDVPVVLYVFIRAYTLKKVFEVIKTARPSQLFLISDGPRDHIATDKENIQKCRKLVEDIDWDCKVYRFYYRKNVGGYPFSRNALRYVFSHVDRCIILEDDILPSVSFFRFCKELLEKYEDDTRVHLISGYNPIGAYNKPSADYFFSRESASWGFAIWKRTFQEFDYDYKFEYGRDAYTMEMLRKGRSKVWYKRQQGYAEGKLVEGHVAGVEFFLRTEVDMQHRLNIIVKNNMVSNIGIGEGSSHSATSLKKLPKRKQKLFFMPIYECTFPLKHPKYMIDDNYYIKQHIKRLGDENRFIWLLNKIESMLRYLISGDVSGILKRLKKYYKKNWKEKDF